MVEEERIMKVLENCEERAKANHNFNCCKLLNKFLENPHVPLKYKPIMREYDLLFSIAASRQGIRYCPWCGTKLPEDLRDEFYDILENEYKMDASGDLEENPNIPEEFKTDEWWKKRKL
jgi:hypothetical protein